MSSIKKLIKPSVIALTVVPVFSIFVGVHEAEMPNREKCIGQRLYAK